MSSLRQAWDRPAVRARIEQVIGQGVFKDAPGLAAAFLREIDALCRSALPEHALYPELYAFLRRDGAFVPRYEQDEAARVERRLRQVLDLVPADQPPQAYVDVGCGNGLLTAALVRAWGLPRDRAFGVEVFDRSQVAGVFTHVPLAGGRIPLPDGSQDLATLFMVLHHEADPDHVLAEVFRVLRPGGRLIVRESDVGTADLDLFNQVMEHFYYRVFNRLPGVPVPAAYQDRPAWERTFRRAGFVVERTLLPEPGNPFTPVHFVLRKPG
jgi:SAM-dependent methyltransferase